MEKVVREIRENQNLEKAKALVRQTKTNKNEIKQEIEELNEVIAHKTIRKKLDKAFHVGDYVKMAGTNSVGKIESIKRNKVEIVSGLMRMTVPLSSLEHANQPLEIKKSKSINTDAVSKTANAATKLDIRGFRVEEAQKRVEEFIDGAMMNNVSFLQIIHGKGSGVLRKVVKAKIREYGQQISIRHPEEEQGGSGVSIIEII